MSWTRNAALAAIVLMTSCGLVKAQCVVCITEWMYNGNAINPGDRSEFVEFTNMGSAPVNMTGWSFDDAGRTPGAQSLTGLGILDPGESGILTEADAAIFRTVWSVPLSVAIAGGNANNLGRSDEINLYDSMNNLADRLTYNDQDGGGVRTSNVSGNPMTLAALGVNDDAQWVLSTVGDAYGSYVSGTFDLEPLVNPMNAPASNTGNPGIFTLYTPAVPEPGTCVLLAIGLSIVGLGRRRS
jgi:predicted extracellular nuclease